MLATKYLQKPCILTVILLLTACIALPIEYEYWLTAKHSGIILDKSTGRPIAGANILLTSKYATSIRVEAVSAADGTFSLGPVTLTERSYHVLPDIKKGRCADMLEVKHKQYQKEIIQWSTEANTTGGVCRNVSATHEIRMQR